MDNKILRLPLDKTKRHFVVGDIHGRFESLNLLLEKANYDPSTDIVYAVGDLIDRGPMSYEVIRFFTTLPNTYAVLGNHEYMATSLDVRWQSTWLRNGGVECLQSLEKHGKHRGWLIDKVQDLPWVIEVGEEGEEGAFRIVHAEHPPMWSDAQLCEIVNSAIDGEDPLVARLIWSRETITHALKNIKCLRPIQYDIIFNTDRTRHNFVGHTPIRKVLTVGDITFLDTWEDNQLSMIEAISGRVYSVQMIE